MFEIWVQALYVLFGISFTGLAGENDAEADIDLPEPRPEAGAVMISDG